MGLFGGVVCVICSGEAGLCLAELVRGVFIYWGPDFRQGWWGWAGCFYGVMGWDEIKWAG